MSNRAEALTKAEQNRAGGNAITMIGAVCFLAVCLVAMSISQTDFSRSTNLIIIGASIGLSLIVITVYAIKAQHANVPLTISICTLMAIIILVYFVRVAWPD